jgi:hypothetical protein
MSVAREPHDRPERHERCPGTRARFESLVAGLADDPSFRRRIARVHLRHRGATLLHWTLRGFGELGCWFAAVPAPGTAARVAVAADARRAS